MKAIVVIDIPDKHILKATNDLYDRLKGYKCSLIPMPTKISTKDITGDDEASLMERCYIYGRNDCIKEIEHESNISD